MDSMIPIVVSIFLVNVCNNLSVRCDHDAGEKPPSVDNVASYREENLLDVSHLQGKDIRSIGWIQASFANEGFKEAKLPKRALKAYLSTKDKLFVDYMDLFIGGRSTQEKKFPPGMFRVMSDILRRRKKRQLTPITKHGVLISRYTLRGSLSAARKDLKRLKKVASEFRDDGSIIIGPYRVKLDGNNSSKKPTLSIQLSGIKEEAGSIIRRYIYQRRRNKSMYRSGSTVSQRKNNKVKTMKNRLGQLQRKRIRLQRRLKQEKRKLRRKLQLRKRDKQKALKQMSKHERRKAKLEARKRRKEERKAKRKLQQKFRRIKQGENGKVV